jgi:hypothetical protein
MEIKIKWTILIFSILLISNLIISCRSVIPKSVRQHTQTEVISQSENEAVIKGRDSTKFEAIDIATFRAKNILGQNIEKVEEDCSQEITATKKRARTFWVCVVKFTKK